MDTPAPTPAPVSKKPRMSTPLAIVLAGALIALAIIVTRTGPITPPTTAAEGLTNTTVRALQTSDHVYGSRDAATLIFEYSDFQCPFCSQIHQTLKKIVDDSDGKVAWVYRHFPLTSIHPQSLPAALASECIAEKAGEKGFWAFAAAAFASQGELSDGFYLAMAQQAGIPSAEFSACMSSKKFQGRIGDDFSEAVAAGGQGTPYVIVQKGKTGVAFAGALPYAQVKAVVDSIVGKE